jgi:MFS family permease
MTSEQYSVALLVFFIGYCLFEVPSNMLISRLRPSVYLPAIMFTWGAVAIAMAGAKNYQQLAGIRAVLGVAEAGYSPGVLFLLSSCRYSSS